MANKTIHQLSAMNEFDSGDEFAVYDTSANTTGKMTIANVLGTSITGLGTTATTIPGAISELNTGLGTVNTLLGSGDISSIGDGSVTGAISSLNNDLATTNNNLSTLSTRTLFNTTLRPITTDQTSNWSYTASHSGFLYLIFISTVRSYCGIMLAGATIGSVAMPNSSMPAATTITVFIRKGQTITISNLTENCYLSTQTAFIAAQD